MKAMTTNQFSILSFIFSIFNHTEKVFQLSVLAYFSLYYLL